MLLVDLKQRVVSSDFIGIPRILKMFPQSTRVHDELVSK